MAEGAMDNSTGRTALWGSSIDPFTSVPIEWAHSYDAVKEGILARFMVNAKMYCLQFRGSHHRAGESFKLLFEQAG